MKNLEEQQEALKAEYRRRYDTVLVRLAGSICAHLSECMHGQPRIDRITARAKSVDRFMKKAMALVDGKLKYEEPLEQIQDQVGARIVVFYNCDVESTDAHIRKYFTAIEFRTVLPDLESEFGYFGHHLVLLLPSDVIDGDMDRAVVPGFFELQIKTLFQHAWSEADHDLGYKPGDTPLTSEQKRLIAFTSAQAWGADHIFDRLFLERL